MERSVRTLAGGLIFPEGPRWRDGKVWISDIHGMRVVTCTPAGMVEEVLVVDERPSGLGFLPDGSLLIASMGDGLLLRWQDGEVAIHADLSGYGVGMGVRSTKLNDMVVDGRGNAYVGVYGVNGEPENTGILLVRPDGSEVLVADGLSIVNGMVVTPDGRCLVAAELGSDVLTAYDIGSDGTLSASRLWAQVDGMTPDGICLDAEGAIWVGSVFSGEFLRVAEGGEVLERLPVPNRLAMAPILGGEDGTTLFLMTAESTKEELLSGGKPPKGFVESVPVEVPGAGWP